MDCRAEASITVNDDGTISAEFGGVGDLLPMHIDVVKGWVETHNTLLTERDRARDIAVALEQELARVVHVLTTQVIPEADSGSAYLCGVQDGYRTATKDTLELLTENTP